MVFNVYEVRYEVKAHKEQVRRVSCLKGLKIEKVLGNSTKKKIRKDLPILQYFQTEKNCCCS